MSSNRRIKAPGFDDSHPLYDPEPAPNYVAGIFEDNGVESVSQLPLTPEESLSRIKQSEELVRKAQQRRRRSRPEQAPEVATPIEQFEIPTRTCSHSVPSYLDRTPGNGWIIAVNPTSGSKQFMWRLMKVDAITQRQVTIMSHRSGTALHALYDGMLAIRRYSTYNEIILNVTSNNRKVNNLFYRIDQGKEKNETPILLKYHSIAKSFGLIQFSTATK